VRGAVRRRLGRRLIESGELTRFYEKQNLSDWNWGRPTLIVVDYAAIHAKQLNGWLSELANNPGYPDRPLRMLLLERHANTGSGWWQTAFGQGGSGAKAVAKLLNPATPWPLRPVESTGVRREILGQTLAQNAHRPELASGGRTSGIRP
jgi:hypothetical protein